MTEHHHELPTPRTTVAAHYLRRRRSLWDDGRRALACVIRFAPLKSREREHG